MNDKCQVFTPRKYVDDMLDKIGYIQNLHGKRILENSCGTGNILAEIVRRYIEDCLSRGFSGEQIKYGLEQDVHGIEIDENLKFECENKLNKIAKKYNIPTVRWQILFTDYLRLKKCNEYDFIVGNPPYIAYSEINLKDRNYIKKHFKSCQKGKFDYCYAFIEKSIEFLSVNGKMAYLIPSSVFKTVFGDDIRKLMCPYIVAINDYTLEKIFKDATVKSSVVIIEKTPQNKDVHYIDSTIGTDIEIVRSELKRKWVFGNVKIGNRRFGDYFKVAHVVATLYNKAFVLKKWRVNSEGEYIVGDYIIEADAVKRTGSPKSLKNHNEEKIIFPYTYDENNKLVRYEEKHFRINFPGTYRYLNSHREYLEKRNSDPNALWFEYGRSQALNNINSEKILMSPVISADINLFKLDGECIPYSGMYITKKSELTLEDGMEILKSKDFRKYIRNIGVPINGKSVRITSKDIEDYCF